MHKEKGMDDVLIAGIDEAGRGPCIGPMSLAVAVIEKRDEEFLIEAGVKDSKLLSPEERASIWKAIEGRLKEVKQLHIYPDELNFLMNRKSLNEIEAMKIGLLLNALKSRPDVVYVDSPDVVQEDFGVRIRKFVPFKVKIIAEHKADFNYPIVGAASIIAKLKRDEAIEELAKEYGDVGSGYPGDARTIAFLKAFVAKEKKLPECARRHWETCVKLMDARVQQKLSVFSPEKEQAI